MPAPQLVYDSARAGRSHCPSEDARAFFHEVLRTSFLLGLTGQPVQLPYVRYSSAGEGRVVRQPMADAIAETLEHATVHEALRAVLQDSRCELVRALRLQMAERYALEHAGNVAAHSGGAQ